MRKTLIAGNWKMHGSQDSIKDLLNGITGQLDASMDSDILVCPPTIYIDSVKKQLENAPVAVGAQNVSEQDQGAFTGEVSGDMLRDFGVEYVLVGHSERRSLFNESDEIVAKKFAKALEHGIKPVLCIGETLEQRENGTTMAVIKQQIDAVIDFYGDRDVALDKISQAVIAYEPVWAIGTGMTATPEQAQDVHSSIRNYLAETSQDTADKIQILYGGSMKASNAEQLLAQRDIDGGLIGGASLKADEFIAICKKAG
ncbi:triose-phosphate isomerase [Kangiella sediminilitoris]|uniref:Triosephosphate isomerase n=1 Tax=Kangiella sediminilitoris TaxID=1144748 RepID=A0A1B3B858_9GAMM|nr:triose-phosphate isomerase [Kangiella sediminilitoris]AOE48989.1 triosephosphate isomerase [Kangiella sediminilitoris]